VTGLMQVEDAGFGLNRSDVLITLITLERSLTHTNSTASQL